MRRYIGKAGSGAAKPAGAFRMQWAHPQKKARDMDMRGWKGIVKVGAAKELTSVVDFHPDHMAVA
jgi:hypothetical protein